MRDVIRVTHVGKFYPPVPGGMERVLHALCQGEREKGIDSRALVVATGPKTVEEAVAGVPVTRAASLLRVGSVWFAPALIPLLKRIRTDILVLHEPNPMALLAYAIARPRHRLVVWYHSEVLRPRWRYKLIYEPFLKVPMRRAVRIFVSSPALVEHAGALAAHRRQCEVIPFGLDIPGPRDAAPPSSIAAVRAKWPGPIALFVGRLVPYKGVGVLLRALRGVEVAAVIIGDGPLRSPLERETAMLGIGDRVFFLGSVDDATVAAWYAASDFFVLPSVTRAEAFGLVQLEAMARGKPVISTRLATGVPWVNQDGVSGLTVEPGDALALAAAIRHLSVHRAERDRLARGAAARAQAQFAKTRMLTLFGDIVEQVVSRPAPVAAFAGAGLS